MSSKNKIEDVEGILRTMSNESFDSLKSEISISSDCATHRLQEGLECLPRTTIELKKAPKRKFIPIEFFKCKLCHESSFQLFADLITHQIATHSKVTIENEDCPVEMFNQIKKFICPTCNFEFPSAYRLGNHLEEKDCQAFSTNKSKAEFFTLEEDGQYKCNACEYKCKSRAGMSKHVKYGHFQRMDCFVSRNDDLRQAALEIQEQNRQQYHKGLQEREEKRLLNREKKRVRDENRKRKQKLIEEKLKVNEKTVDKKRSNIPSSSKSSPPNGSNQSSPQKFDKTVTTSIARDLLSRTGLRFHSDVAPNSNSDPTADSTSDRINSSLHRRMPDQILFPLNRFHNPLTNNPLLNRNLNLLRESVIQRNHNVPLNAPNFTDHVTNAMSAERSRILNGVSRDVENLSTDSK